MFSGIRNRWREARADVAQKEAEEILIRYELLGGYERYELLSAFEYTKSDLESEHGEFATWNDKDKGVIAKQLLEGARQGFRMAPYGASGHALLSLYLEAQTLPGEQAQRLVASIEDWHKRAVERDLSPRRQE